MCYPSLTDPLPLLFLPLPSASTPFEFLFRPPLLCPRRHSPPSCNVTFVLVWETAEYHEKDGEGEKKDEMEVEEEEEKDEKEKE